MYTLACVLRDLYGFFSVSGLVLLTNISYQRRGALDLSTGLLFSGLAVYLIGGVGAAVQLTSQETPLLWLDPALLLGVLLVVAAMAVDTVRDQQE